jgi:hypothetical protein
MINHAVTWYAVGVRKNDYRLFPYWGSNDPDGAINNR